MSLIQHLSRLVTPSLKSQIADSIGPNTAIDSLLEQFYAIFATRISDSAMLPQIAQMTSQAAMPNQDTFAQVWATQIERDTIIHELADSHHVSPNIVHQLISPASNSAFRQITQLATTQGQSVTDYLHTELEAMRAYLPTWAGSVIPVQLLTCKPSAKSQHPHPISQAAPIDQQTSAQSSNLHSFDNNNSQTHNIHSKSTIDSPRFAQNDMSMNNQNIHNPLHNNQPTNHNINNQTHISPASPRVSQSHNHSQQAQSRPRPNNSTINPRANQSTNVNKPKKSLGLAMILLPLLGLALIGGGAVWWMSGQKTNKSSQITVAPTNTDTKTPNSEVVKAPPQKNANETLVKDNPNKQQSVTFDANDLNSPANGNGLPNVKATNNDDTTNSAAQQITGVENRGNQNSIVYEFESQNQGVDPNSLEALANTTIGSDSAPQPPQITTPQTGQSLQPQVTPNLPMTKGPSKTIPVEPSVIGVEPDPNNPLPESNLKKKLSDPSQKSEPRRTYSPITGKTLIITGDGI